jgi:hypothetical protein
LYVGAVGTILQHHLLDTSNYWGIVDQRVHNHYGRIEYIEELDRHITFPEVASCLATYFNRLRRILEAFAGVTKLCSAYLVVV